jgi:hypothetical protein
MLTCVDRISVLAAGFMSEKARALRNPIPSTPMQFVERLLEEAATRGEFDGCDGRPLQLDDGPGWWVRRHLEASRRAEDAHAVLAGVEDQLGRVWLLSSEAAVIARVNELNATLSAAGLGEASLDPAETVATWRRFARLRPGRR